MNPFIQLKKQLQYFCSGLRLCLLGFANNCEAPQTRQIQVLFP